VPNLAALDFTKLANSCNSWRIFWDVQAGQYAHTEQQRFDCVSGYLEFAATGSTELAAQFSPNCPGDWRPRNHPSSVDHAAMVAAAGPGAFNDADMLPIGANYTMGGGGKVVPIQAFSPTQARSAMAMWAVLASPLMIGADVRSMDADSRSVWLNKGLIQANQDPLGRQGTRVRGNTTACQVWKRELSGGEMLCVIYNNGGCPPSPPAPPVPPAPTPLPARWLGPFPKIYSDADCANVGNHLGEGELTAPSATIGPGLYNY
jgi:hypothetical protein